MQDGTGHSRESVEALMLNCVFIARSVCEQQQVNLQHLHGSHHQLKSPRYFPPQASFASSRVVRLFVF